VSPAVDEEQIYHPIATLDTVLDRCEDTHEVLRLTLLSQHLQQSEHIWAYLFETGSQSSSLRPCFAREISCLGEQEPKDTQDEAALSQLCGDELSSSDSNEDEDHTGRPDAIARGDEQPNALKPASIGPPETCWRSGSSLPSP
jgi:hypothetical protein